MNKNVQRTIKVSTIKIETKEMCERFRTVIISRNMKGAREVHQKLQNYTERQIWPLTD